MNIKIIVCAAVVAVLAVVGVAQAGGNKKSNPTQRATQKRERMLLRPGRTTTATISKGRRGPRGFRGPKGSPGAQGPPGSFKALPVYYGGPVFLCGYFEGGCAVNAIEVQCPAGSQSTGGGYTGAGIRAFSSYPTQNGWYVAAANESEFSTSFKAYVVCAS